MNILKNPLVIVANGDFPSHPIPLEILNKAVSILACDGAADTLLENNYTPNLILGDLDSLSKESKLQYADIIIKETNQSDNDFRKAINYAIKNNIKDITILGASGKREDHMIGNIFSLLNYKNLNIKLFTDTGVFTCIHNNKHIESYKGQQVSIFTLDKTITISSKELKYNFMSSSISDICRGTLNESLGDYFEMKISHGSLLIYQTYK